MKHKSDGHTSRREFLSDCATIAPAVVVAATPVGAVAASDASGLTEGKGRKGYRLTQHITDYYKSAKA